ncbi:MAG: hypothetical protein P4L40_18515 [Terracidiphilus sp.]|nr:hypothetical protein [Terracidiphilus sp.]
MHACAAVSASLSACVAQSLGPLSGDDVLLDESGRCVITASGQAVLTALQANTKGNAIASLLLAAALAFGRATGE